MTPHARFHADRAESERTLSNGGHIVYLNNLDALANIRRQQRILDGPMIGGQEMMQFVMQPGMVYQYPLWWVALLVGLVALGAVLFELTVHQFLSLELRRRHNDVAAAIFSVVGVTFAVLLAFVAMLAWEGFNKAKAAGLCRGRNVLDVYNVSVGLAGPETSQMRDNIIGYLETVVRVEWPAQAEGQIVDRGKAYLEKAEHARNRSQTLQRRRQATCTRSCCNRWRGCGTRDSRDCLLPRPLFQRSSGS